MSDAIISSCIKNVLSVRFRTIGLQPPRKSYDPILHALRDWEQANLIIIDRDFDIEAKQYKAMRIWIRPEFFHGLGFSALELREVVSSFSRWMEKQGLKGDVSENGK